MIKVKTKTICSVCQGEIPYQKEKYFDCPICGNQAWQTEIIEEFEEPSWWEKIRRWWFY